MACQHQESRLALDNLWSLEYSNDQGRKRREEKRDPGNEVGPSTAFDWPGGFISKLTCQFSSFFVQNFVKKSQLCENNDHTLQKQRQLWAKNVDSFVRIMFKLCTNVNFVRTTSSLNEQCQLCNNNVHTCPNSAESTMKEREIID